MENHSQSGNQKNQNANNVRIDGGRDCGGGGKKGLDR